MKKITFKDFEQFAPYYSLTDKYGEWEGTILDLMQHPDISDKDKILAFTREGIVSDRTLRFFAVACAREVQHLMTDEWEAASAASAAAWEAAWEAAWVAAWAARAATWTTAWAAASAAAWEAANATWAAGWEAWAAAVWAKQVQVAVELINKYEL
jgi:hypothetical protein